MNKSYKFVYNNPVGYYKGFTLIELLAIIVILAIIAVITVPLILGIIDDAKLNSITASAYGYKSAIQNYSMYLQTADSNSTGIKGSYTVDELRTLGLEVKGQEPDSGIILVDNEGISGCLKYDEYASFIYNNKVINTTKGNCPIEKLVTTGDGLYKSDIEPGKLIYRGQNPNNYIILNEGPTSSPSNVTYRIVSYEPDGTVKVVRNVTIGAKTWDTANTRKSDGTDNTFCTEQYGCNVWGCGSNTLHNGNLLGDSFNYMYYPSASAATLTNGLSGKVGSDSTLNTYLNSKTNNSTNSWQPAIVLDQYIDNHLWNVGGIYNIADDKGIIKEKEEERQLQWIGKIALLNISEFAETSTNPNCVSVKYGSSSACPCKESNWTFKTYNQWSLSSYSSGSRYVWFVSSVGSFNSYSASNSVAVHPAFYLKSGLSLNGSGVIGDEYQIN